MATTLERFSLERVQKLEDLIQEVYVMLALIDGDRDDNHIIYDELTREQLLEQISLIRADVDEAVGMCTTEVPYKDDPRENLEPRDNVYSPDHNVYDPDYQRLHDEKEAKVPPPGGL